MDFDLCPRAKPIAPRPHGSQRGAGGRPWPPSHALTRLVAACLVGSVLAIAALGQTCAAEPGSTGGARPPLRQLTAQSLAVAERYFQAYIARQWDTVEPLLAEDASFADPTAATLWSGVAQQGKAAMMKGFRSGYEGIADMRFKPLRTLASGHHVLFEGDLDWTLVTGSGRRVRSVGAFAVLLVVRDGRITSHTDLLDYRPFVDALEAR